MTTTKGHTMNGTKVFGPGSLERIELTITDELVKISGSYHWDCGTTQHSVPVAYAVTRQEADNQFDLSAPEDTASEMLDEFLDEHQDPCLFAGECG